jgi:hypothetical protein
MLTEESAAQLNMDSGSILRIVSQHEKYDKIPNALADLSMINSIAQDKITD